MTGECIGVGGRGCPCAFHVAARPKAREYARRQRERILAEQQRTATTCPKRHGSGVCGAMLEASTDGNGRTIVWCPMCKRQARGICRDCSRPVEGTVGKALRCAEHKQLASEQAVRDYATRNPEKVRASARAHYASDPDRRARRNDLKRAWRKANPEKVRAQKKRYVDRHRADPTSTYNRYHARYRKKHRQHYREIQNTRNAIAREHRKPPPCKECGKPTKWTPVSAAHPGAPWQTCMRCAWPHQRKKRRRVRRAAAKLRAADPTFGVPPKPVEVRRPPLAAVRGPEFERLCITPGCEIVVTRRKKKCTKCRARDRELALQALAPHRGRGRRVDLERAS